MITMNKHLILLCAVTPLLFSCTKEAEAPATKEVQPGETITFTAGWADSDETRTILQSDGTSVWWDAAEQINVFFSNKASGKFTSTNAQPQAIVDYQGSLPIVVGSIESDNPAHAYWAVYPYNAANTCDGESVTLTVPSIQTALEGTFANKMFPSIATSTNFHLAFYNICGGARFSVANEGISSITFKANNGESLVGKVQVGFDGVPVIKKVSEGVSEVTVNAPDGGFIPGKYYFATILPQTLSNGVSLIYKKSDGKVASTSLSQSITINRSRFGKMDEKDKELEFKDDGGGITPVIPDLEDCISFADEKVKAKLVAAFDTNQDGELSYKEASAVTSGEAFKNAFGAIKTYKSFDEFQYFTGLSTVPDSMFSEWNLLSSVIIPNSITTIGQSAFNKCSSLASVVIPESVSTIETLAFFCCTGLESIVIPDSVTTIEDRAFEKCCSLASVTLPKDLFQIGAYLFCECSGLMSVHIPEGVNSIGQYAFNSCSNLASISIPETVTTIENCAFYGCSKLTSVVIPEGVLSIGQMAFGNCNLSFISIPLSTSFIGYSAFAKNSKQVHIRGNCPGRPSAYIDPDCLISYEIIDGVSSIGNNAFQGCNNLSSIVIPDGVTSIGQYAFDGCNSLPAIIIPESVSDIGHYAFQNCSSLSSIIIPKKVTVIDNSTFSGCVSLTSAFIPDRVQRIRNSAFRNCTNLTSITIPNSVIEIESYAFYGCRSIKTITIPDSVTSIGQSAFCDCSSLESIDISDSVSAIEGHTFENCSSLSSLIIPESVTLISYYSFSGCINLKTVVLPESVTLISWNAFHNCRSLTSITIPESVSQIWHDAFNGCSSLASVYVLRKDPPEGGLEMFYNTNDCSIYVPSGSVEAYKSAQYWSDYADRIQAIPE